MHNTLIMIMQNILHLLLTILYIMYAWLFYREQKVWRIFVWLDLLIQVSQIYSWKLRIFNESPRKWKKKEKTVSSLGIETIHINWMEHWVNLKYNSNFSSVFFHPFLLQQSDTIITPAKSILINRKTMKSSLYWRICRIFSLDLNSYASYKFIRDLTC